MTPLIEKPINFLLYKIVNRVTGEVVSTGISVDFFSAKEVEFADPSHTDEQGEPHRYSTPLHLIGAGESPAAFYHVETINISAPHEAIAHALRSYIENPLAMRENFIQRANRVIEMANFADKSNRALLTENTVPAEIYRVLIEAGIGVIVGCFTSSRNIKFMLTVLQEMREIFNFPCGSIKNRHNEEAYHAALNYINSCKSCNHWHTRTDMEISRSYLTSDTDSRICDAIVLIDMVPRQGYKNVDKAYKKIASYAVGEIYPAQ